ncbi:Alpha-1-antiproteinase F [Halotydeus destructor]|nr:Alpha-1-antiproteinase F [Halotydeus destructor]
MQVHLLITLCLIGSSLAAVLDISKAINEFGVNFLNLVGDEVDKVIFSPVSLATGFGMVAIGAQNSSRTQLLEALELHNLTGLADKYHELVRSTSLRRQQQRWGALELANNLLVNQNFAINQDYVNTIRDKFQGVVQEVDLTKGEETKEAINEWVRDKTRGKIGQLFDEPLDPRTVAVLLNVIYFKGLWSQQFHGFKNSEGLFYGDTKNSTVTYMNNDANRKVYHCDQCNATAIELAFITGTSMFIVIPDQGEHDDLDDFIDDLDDGDLEQIITSNLATSGQHTRVYLPKFSFDSSYDLKPIMMKLNVSDMFTQSADLSGIGGAPGELYVDQALHKAYIDVNEEGVEAAGATGLSIGARTIARQIPRDFRVNRPFVFVIRSLTTGANLFMGKVSNL